MRCFLAFLFVLAALTTSPQARAEKRVALVIGNSSYENTAALKNPKNDAADITALLKKLGFEVVEGVDLDKRKMERAIRDFGVKLAGADLALFFYAGHGLQVSGKNYMVPTDARLAVEGDVDFEVLELTLVLKQMEREATTRVVLLDACRDNPLTRSLRTSMTAPRSGQLGQGLAKLDRTQVGTLIGYSTEPGSVASDGDGRNSPYTHALLAHLDAAGKDLSSILSAVRGEVVKATAGQQVPWESTSLLGPVFLKQEVPKPAEVAPKPEAKPDTSVEVAFWNTVKDSKVALELQIYLDRFPTGAYADIARLRLDQLQAAAKAEEARKAEEATKNAEAVKAASLQKADAAKSTELSAKDGLALTRALQVELKRIGCDPGTTDGKWGDKAKEALGEFVRLSKSFVPTEEPTEAALRAVTVQVDRICPLRCPAGQNEASGKCIAKAKPELQAKKSTSEAVRPQGERKGGKDPMCWSNTAAAQGVLVPCSAPFAGPRAF